MQTQEIDFETPIFETYMTKKEQLLRFIQRNRRVRTSDVIKWGSYNYLNRAERTSRDLATEGRIKRLSDHEKIIHGYGKTKESVWEFVK